MGVGISYMAATGRKQMTPVLAKIFMKHILCNKIRDLIIATQFAREAGARLASTRERRGRGSHDHGTVTLYSLTS